MEDTINHPFNQKPMSVKGCWNIFGVNVHQQKQRSKKRQIFILPFFLAKNSCFYLIIWGRTRGKETLIWVAIEWHSLCTSETMNPLKTGVMMTACNYISFMFVLYSQSPLPLHNMTCQWTEVRFWGSASRLLGCLNHPPLTLPRAKVIHTLNLHSRNLCEQQTSAEGKGAELMLTQVDR